MKGHPNRRAFLRSTALAGIGFWVAGGGTRAASRSPNEKLNLGIIGVNRRGAANMKSVGTENIVALCDVNEEFLAQASQAHRKAKTYVDWREMLQQTDIDAVTVSTTDHTHAPASITAMQRGMGVYCEKPLAHTVEEARIMGEVYRQTKVATQMGTQIHATDNYRRVVELIQSGAIGPVREAHVWCNRVGPSPERPTEEHAVPDGFHWDLWLGPAPRRAYYADYLPGCMTWEQRWDWGNGCLGDMGSHLIDLPFWALKLRHPVSAEAEGSHLSPESYPNWLIARWQHPARDDMPPVKLHWYDGVQRPESPEGHDLNRWGKGILFVGDDGMLLADYGKRILLPEEKFKDFQPPEAWIEPSLGHHQEWLHACKTGAPTLCNFDYSGALVENNLLGTVAFRVGKKLQWDAKELKATNCPEADRYLRKEYRQGWELPRALGF